MTDRDQMVSGADAATLAMWRLAVPDDLPDAAMRGLPADFLTGWFDLCRSNQVPVGGVLGVRRFGQKLTVWRGADGVARALPARCPHAWADMTLGGKVHGDWLECPFHSWRWDEAGALRDIPYSVKPIKPKGGDCRPRWPLHEQDGTMLIWHHADRAEPLWRPRDVGDRIDPTAGEWEFSTGVEALWDAIGDASVRCSGNGDLSLRMAIPLKSVNDPTDGVTATADGPGQCRIQHLASGSALVATAGPIDRDRTHLGLTMAADTGDDARAIDLFQAVAHAIDRIKPILDRTSSRPRGTMEDWLARFRQQTPAPTGYPEAVIANQERER